MKIDKFRELDMWKKKKKANNHDFTQKVMKSE